MKKLLTIILIILMLSPIFAQNDFHFAVLSDRSGGVNQKAFDMVVEDIQQLHPDFVVTVGDLSSNALETHYKQAMDTVNILDMPVYFTPGNNDIVDEKSRQMFTRYTGNKPYYSFDYQNTHFIILDNSTVESYAEMGKKQKKWLERDLFESRNFENIFVFIHKPFWANRIAKNKKDKMHSLFKKYGVDAVFTGHWHQYAHNEYDGIDYYLAGSSGGGFGKENEELGKFYQFLWCRVKGEKLHVSIVKAGNIFKDDLVTIQEEQLSYKIPNELIKSKGSFNYNDPVIKSEVSIRNDTKNRIEKQLVIKTDSNWIIDRNKYKINLKPGERFTKKLRFKKNGDIYPLPKIEFVYPFGRNKKIHYKKSLNIKPVVRINKINRSPVIDGKLDDKVWDEKSTKLNQFCDLNGDKSNVDKTEVYIAHNKNNLYIAAILSEPKMSKIKADAKKRDERVYTDDCFGMLLSQNPKKIFQYYINSNTVIWDSLVDLKAQKRKTEWNGEFEKGVRKLEDKWVVEMKISLSSVNINKNSPFYMNVRRIQKTKNSSGFLTPAWGYNQKQYIKATFEK